MEQVTRQAKSWSLTIAVSIAGMVLSAAIITTYIATRPSPCCGSQVPFATIYHEPLSRIDTVLTQGDGHAFAVIARDPLLQRPGVLHGASELAYRAQRPVWAYLTWTGSLGQPGLTGWALVGLSILAAGAACGVASLFLLDRDRSPWWALAIPLFAFETLTELTPELLAVALLGAGVLLWQRRRPLPALVLLVLAVLTRETLLVGVAALACWHIAHVRGDVGHRLAATWKLVIPFLIYAGWVVLLHLHLGAWPVNRSNDRLSLVPGAGLLEGIKHASSSTTIVLWAVVGVGLTAAVIVWARDDVLAWIAVGFAGFGAVLGPEVWSPAAGYQRTLVPLFYFAPIALLGALRGRRSVLQLDRLGSARAAERAASITG